MDSGKIEFAACALFYRFLIRVSVFELLAIFVVFLVTPKIRGKKWRYCGAVARRWTSTLEADKSAVRDRLAQMFLFPFAFAFFGFSELF